MFKNCLDLTNNFDNVVFKNYALQLLALEPDNEKRCI